MKIWKFRNSTFRTNFHISYGLLYYLYYYITVDYYITMDYNITYIKLFDIIRFKVFLSFIYFYYILFKHWQISVELFHVPSLSRKDLTGIQW